MTELPTGPGYFEYGEKEISYLKRKDKKLRLVIERLGHINREVDDDLFSSIVHHIIGQQISTKAQKTIWGRLQECAGNVSPETLNAMETKTLQSCGMTFRKADYIKDAAKKILVKEIDLDKMWTLGDEDVISELTRLRGIGVWTAEMILLFCMQRPDVFSYDDLALKRGMKMVYHHKEITRKMFERYRKRFSPYGSTASIYFWRVSSGAIEDLDDYLKTGNSLTDTEQ